MDMYDKQENADGKIVLCGASAYEKKYYFNEQFKALPESIKEELHIICVLFTEEVGGVFTVVFDEEGQIALETDAYDEDVLYDEISSGLLVNEIRRKKNQFIHDDKKVPTVMLFKNIGIDIAQMKKVP